VANTSTSAKAPHQLLNRQSAAPPAGLATQWGAG